MTTTTEPPKEALSLALERVKAAQQLVNTRSEELGRAQARANALDGFPAAAQLESDNAEARWRVLDESAKIAEAEKKGLRERHDLLQERLSNAEAELSRAKAIEDSIQESRSALENITGTDKATGSAGQWVDSAQQAVTALGTTATKLNEAANTAPEGHKKDLRSACQTVQAQQRALTERLGTLQSELQEAKRKIQAVPSITGLAALQDTITTLQTELASVEAEQEAKHPAVSGADLTKAKTERDNAQLALQEAPEAQRAAQVDLRGRQAELKAAQTGLTVAQNELDKVQQDFVEAIRVSAPDANGWALGRAVLKPGMEIPNGYRLGWTAGGAHVELEDKQGLRVRIDTATLPPGDTDVTARLESLSATS
jgi:chromosome segregation ATPase